MDNDGIQQAGRGIGRFFTALVPWALGVGAVVWFSVYVGMHEYRREVAQEDRAATYVGAAERPTSKIAIKIKPVDCTHVTRADVDGVDVLMYAQNDCHEPIHYLEWHAASISPDGTILSEEYTNWQCPAPSESGSVAECRLKIKGDDRTASVLVWTKRTP